MKELGFAVLFMLCIAALGSYYVYSFNSGFEHGKMARDEYVVTSLETARINQAKANTDYEKSFEALQKEAQEAKTEASVLKSRLNRCALIRTACGM